MADEPIPGTEVDRAAWNGSGPHGPGPLRVITVHCTTGPHGSLEGARSTLHARHAESNSLVEHAAAARGGRRHVTLVSPDRASKALRNERGGTETNKAGVNYQVEVVGPAEDPVAGTTADDWRYLGRELGKVGARLGIRNRVVSTGGIFRPYPPTRVRPPAYLGREPWRDLDDRDDRNGWVCHADWLENSHGDPGDLSSPDPRLAGYSPLALMLEGAAQTNPAGGAGPNQEDPLMGITLAQIEAAASRAATKAVAGLAHVGKAVACRDNRTGRVYVVSGAGKFHAVNRDVLLGMAVLNQLRPVDVNRIPVIDGAKYLEHLPDIGELADDIDELVDLEAAKSADLKSQGRELVAALEALTGPDPLPVDALEGDEAPPPA